ncbi:MAG: tRNA (guanosine(46)-N7)-methyltransferase TrmB [Candidatus Kapaibacteriota bacterium]|jgi:tRNA (guanine-N7-)-methyltransferase
MIDFSELLLKYPQPVRYRHHIKSNVYFPYHENITEDSHYPALIDKLDWIDVFQNGKKPNAIDVGCGIGKFLIEYADSNKNTNILGIEVRPIPVEWIRTVIQGEKIENCGVIHYTLANGLDFIEDNSLDSIFYFFPDPWFKYKQAKRRVLKQEFLEICYNKLNENGKFYIQTDVEELHKYHLLELTKYNKFNLEILEINQDWELTKTDQELHVIKKGFNIHRIICTK